MTPLELARRECANISPAGRCWILEAMASPDLQDYRRPLTDWTPQQWLRLVTDARQRGESAVRYRTKSGGAIEAYFCPRCGHRMSIRHAFCPECRPSRRYSGDTHCLLSHDPPKGCSYFERDILPLADDPSPQDNPKLQGERIEAREAYRDMQLAGPSFAPSAERSGTEYMRDNPQGDRCSRCGEKVANVRGDACLCSRCTQLLALRSPDPQRVSKAAERTCSQCGAPIGARARKCAGCKRLNRRKAVRESVRRHREQKAVLV